MSNAIVDKTRTAVASRHDGFNKSDISRKEFNDVEGAYGKATIETRRQAFAQLRAHPALVKALHDGLNYDGYVSLLAAHTTLGGSLSEEAAVAKRRDFSAPTPENVVKANPNIFISRCTQLDGVKGLGRTVDATTCGPMAVLIGMTAADPDSMVGLAFNLTTVDGKPSDACKRVFPRLAKDPAAMHALYELRTGTFSPQGMHDLAIGFYHDCRAAVPPSAGPDGKAAPGTNFAQLMHIRAGIRSLGVDVPPMELQLYMPSDGSIGHWAVGVHGKLYNSWPERGGRSVVGQGPGAVGHIGRLVGGHLCQKVFMTDNQINVNIYDFQNDGATVNYNGKTMRTFTDPPMYHVRLDWDAAKNGYRTKAQDINADLNAWLQTRCRPLQTPKELLRAAYTHGQ